MKPENAEAQQARQAAVRLLAQREHSARELMIRLSRRFDPGVVQGVLEKLQETGLQSDERFAEAYVHARCNKGYGPLRIRAELHERGLEPALIDASLDVDENHWRLLMLKVARRKFGETKPSDRGEQARRGRFLASRGFPSHLINEYLFS